MAICGSYIFEFSVSREMEKKDKNDGIRRIPTFLQIPSNINC
jgi:hypothetical protein